MRLLTRHARLYTEMVTTGAILHGDRQRLLGFDAAEHKLALQLGGSDPRQLAECAAIGADFGYDEINLNCGCPSDRVQDGAFGACLMREPERVGEAVAAMKRRVDIPITVKCRIGVDDQEPPEALWSLTNHLVAGGVGGLVVHARKAWLEGLSPKENRDIPPLDYPLVRELKRDFPRLPIILNGGLKTLEDAKQESVGLDGVMLGRAAYHNMSILLAVDPMFFGVPAPFADVADAVEAYLNYVERFIAGGGRLADVSRHMLGLFGGETGARAFRRQLAVNAPRRGAGIDVILAALAEVRPARALELI